MPKPATQGEGGHWYNPETVAQVATVIGKAGKPISINSTRAAENRLLGGITTVTKEWQNAMLAQWHTKTALQALLDIISVEKGIPLTDEQKSVLVARSLEEGPKRIGGEAADKGKDIHAAVDRHFRGEPVEAEFMPWVDTAIDALASLGLYPGQFKAEVDGIGEGYGCRGDLVCQYPPMYIDIKTRDFTPEDVAEAIEKRGRRLKGLGKLTPYQTEPLQVVGNIDALILITGQKEARGLCLYLSRSDPSIHYLHEFTSDELDQARVLLKACVTLFNVPRGLGA